jgi:hypothetical protein
MSSMQAAIPNNPAQNTLQHFEAVETKLVLLAVHTLSQLFMAQQQNAKISLFSLDRELCDDSPLKSMSEILPPAAAPSCIGWRAKITTSRNALRCTSLSATCNCFAWSVSSSLPL